MVRIRTGSPTDAPSLQHIELTCRVAATFLPGALRDPGSIRPRAWRAWLLSAPPFDRHRTPRAVFVAYEHNDILGFVACMHDSLFAGYRADIAGLYVLPRYRRQGIGARLLGKAAQWLLVDGITRVTADCYAHDPTRSFCQRMGAFVISSAADETDATAVITYGFPNLKEIAERG